VEHRLHRQDLVAPGTRSARAEAPARKHFGDSQNLVVVLAGPPGPLAAQTRRVTQRIDRLPHIDAVGPFAPGAGRELRPSPTRTLVLVRLNEKFEIASHDGDPLVRRAVEQSVRRPVRSYVTGYADVGAGIDRETIAALQ